VGAKKRGFKQEPSLKDRSWWKRLWEWTEFGKKTGWQWLELLSALAIPVVLAVAGYWFTMQQDARQQAIEDQRAQQAQKIENQRAEAERTIQQQNAQDEALQSYLDQMSNLLLEKDLRASEEDSEVRTLARARTLTVLERLDPSRKTAVMRFLVEAELVQRVLERDPTISLSGADLSGADLSKANLSKADLSLIVGGNLKADLRFADLSGAVGVTKKELKQQAKSLRGTTMPDGTILYATSEFDPALSFTLGHGWQDTAGPIVPDLSMLIAEGETTDQLFIESPEGGQLIFTNPRHVYAPTNLSQPKELRAPESAEEWVSWLRNHPNLDTSKLPPVNVGGASGKRIDVTASSMPKNYPRKVCGPTPCVPLYPTSGGPIVVAPSGTGKEQYVIVDVGGETVIINVTASADKFDAFSPKAQKVLDTAEWKGG
jgi:hypothetical protein